MSDSLRVIDYGDAVLYEVTLNSDNAWIKRFPAWYEIAGELREWLCEHVGDEARDYLQMRTNPRLRWSHSVGTHAVRFQFRDKQTAMIFKLTWGGL